jgi:transcriptional regulator with XRE-family HTH domain
VEGCNYFRMTAQTNAVTAHHPLHVVVAANIRAEAARRGLNQTDMARLLGVSRMTMSDRNRGRTPWALDDIERVAQLFHIEAADLLARPEGFEPPTFWLGAGADAEDADVLPLFDWVGRATDSGAEEPDPDPEQ